MILNLKAAIFDVDDTLFDFTGCHAIAMQRVAEHVEKAYGIPEKWLITEYKAELDKQFEKYPQFVNCHCRTIRFQRIAERDARLPLGVATELSDMYWNTLIEVAEPLPGVVDFIKSLKAKGLKLGICTDMTADWQIKKLVKLGIVEYLDFIVSSEEAGIEKPDNKIFELCLNKAGDCSPSEAIMFGDSYKKDIAGAIGAGMHAVWINPKGIQIEKPLPGVIEIASYVGIENIFQEAKA